MTKQTVISSVALLAASVAFSVTAGEQDAFAQLDKDGDGYITALEAEAGKMLKEGWAAKDANGDGKVDQAEFSALEMKPMEKPMGTAK